MKFSQEHMQIGGIAKWAKVIKPQVDDFNPEGLWSVELEVDEDTQEALTSNGVQPKKGTENCFVFKRKTKSRKGSDIPAPWYLIVKVSRGMVLLLVMDLPLI